MILLFLLICTIGRTLHKDFEHITSFMMRLVRNALFPGITKGVYIASLQKDRKYLPKLLDSFEKVLNKIDAKEDKWQDYN